MTFLICLLAFTVVAGSAAFTIQTLADLPGYVAHDDAPQRSNWAVGLRSPAAA